MFLKYCGLLTKLWMLVKTPVEGEMLKTAPQDWLPPELAVP